MSEFYPDIESDFVATPTMTMHLETNLHTTISELGKYENDLQSLYVLKRTAQYAILDSVFKLRLDHIFTKYEQMVESKIHTLRQESSELQESIHHIHSKFLASSYN